MTGPGRLFAVVGPSGAGKDTLIAAAAARRPDLAVVRRVITRPADAGGEDFEAVDRAEFRRRKAAGRFALDWQAHGLCYGIPSGIDAVLAAGRDVIFNGSRAVLREAAARYPCLKVLHVTASPAILAERLAGRGRESPGEIAERLERAGYALPDGLDMACIRNDGTVAAAAEALLACLQPESG
jgi:ribose 1,5-bisphosphokinase